MHSLANCKCHVLLSDLRYRYLFFCLFTYFIRAGNHKICLKCEMKMCKGSCNQQKIVKMDEYGMHWASKWLISICNLCLNKWWFVSIVSFLPFPIEMVKLQIFHYTTAYDCSIWMFPINKCDWISHDWYWRHCLP